MSSSFGKQNFSVADFDLLFSWMVLLDGGQKGQNQVSFLTIFPLRSLSLNSEVRRAFPGDIPPPSAGCLPIPFTCPTFAAPLPCWRPVPSLRAYCLLSSSTSIRVPGGQELFPVYLCSDSRQQLSQVKPNIAGEGHHPLLTAPTSDELATNLGATTTTSGLIIPQMIHQTQESAYLWLQFYYGERIQTGTSQKKRNLGWGLRGFQTWSFLVPPRRDRHITLWHISGWQSSEYNANQESSPELQYSGFLLAFLYVGMVDWVVSQEVELSF